MKRMDAINGALVADAACMGLHWLYDQEQLQRVATTGDVLFRAPDAEIYKERRGYFAHADRLPGQSSHYGEHVQLIGNLLRSGDRYTTQAHQQQFLAIFGPGGSWVGYADRPTKALVATLLQQTEDSNSISGSDDDQLPALAAVAPLFAFEDPVDLEHAVRVTNDNDIAVSGARVVQSCLLSLSEGVDLQAALRQSCDVAGGELKDLLVNALAMENYQPLEVANQYGLACHMPQGLPLVWHLLHHASDYESAVTDNVLCGGDTCGRSLALGAIAGLNFGVPENLGGRYLGRLF